MLKGIISVSRATQGCGEKPQKVLLPKSALCRGSGRDLWVQWVQTRHWGNDPVSKTQRLDRKAKVRCKLHWRRQLCQLPGASWEDLHWDGQSVCQRSWACVALQVDFGWCWAHLCLHSDQTSLTGAVLFCTEFEKKNLSLQVQCRINPHPGRFIQLDE